MAASLNEPQLSVRRARRTGWAVAVLALGLSALGSDYASADAPDAKSLFPAGARAGDTVEITAMGTFKPWPVRAYITGEGVRIEPAKTEGKFSVVVDLDAMHGIRWIRFANDDGVSAARPFVIGGLVELNEKEPNEELSQATEVGSEPRIVNGTLAKGEKGADLDVFRVPLKKGATLVAALDANRTLGSPIDGVLQIVSAGGFVLAQCHDELGLDPRLVFTAPADGDYFVRVFGFTSVGTTALRFVGDPAGVYRLTLTTGPFLDYKFPFWTPPDKKHPFIIQGWNLPEAKEWPQAGTLRLPHLVELPESLRGAPIYTCGTAFSLGSLSGASPAEVAAKPTAPPAKDEPCAIEVPALVNGRLHRPGMRNAYSLKVVKNQNLRIRVISQELAFPVDPLLKVEASDGTQLLRADDGKRGEYDVDTTYRAAADGEIRLVVEDLFGAGGERYVYLLDVRTIEPDFEIGLATSELYGRVGEDLEIPITIERVGGLADDIEIRVEGLPTEIGTASAVSTAKGESAKKVTLKLKGAKAFTGPVRVVGTTVPAAPPAPKPGAKADSKSAAKNPSKPAAPLRRMAIAKIAAVTGASIDEVLLVVGTQKPKK